MNFETWLKQEHSEIPSPSAHAVLKLVEEGATIPFIARYRKEQTGNLDEVGIQKVIDSKEKWDFIVKRQQFIIEEIERQQKLTPELKQTLLQTFQPQLLEDLYLPYKVKRKSKAQLAKEAGLQPLADWIWGCGHGTESPLEGQTLELWAFTFRSEEKGFADATAAIQGAQDILVEKLSETQELRQLVRATSQKQGQIRTSKGPKAKSNSKYETYFDHAESVASLLEPQNSHRYLAMKRGWIEEELTLKLGGPSIEVPAEGDAPATSMEDPEFDRQMLAAFEQYACPLRDSAGNEVLLKAARLALRVHVFPAIENEIQKSLKEVADEVAIGVFAENVKTLLLSSPFGAKAVLGVDPGIRTGCKLAVVDSSGKFMASSVMYLQTEDQKSQAREMLFQVAQNAQLSAIAVGNGTAGRETEVFIRQALKERNISLPVVMVNEAGASVYSASEAAREEFPELDITVRGAISIARRLQDPLAELVKIDPKSIGVGQYQHDVSQPALKRSLDLVVDTCVNQVGVDVNTASYHLLSRVAGIGSALAKAIVEYRGAQGLFKSREALHEVPRLSKKTFEQAAGFLRIPGAENPLDTTGVHPERYPLLEEFAQKMGKQVKDLLGAGASLLKTQANELRERLGEFTFLDIIKELEKPGRDPREEFVPFQFRDDIHDVKDLQKDMICPGIVTNVTNFGAFVDIGVHQDGLVHISQLSHQFVKDPQEAVHPGDRVKVKVLDVNLEKNQISLSIKAATEAPRPQRDHRERERTQKRHAPAPQALPPLDPNRPAPQVKPRDPNAAHPEPRRPAPSTARAAPGNKPRGPQPIFNNAFAGLAALKGSLKSGK